MVSLGSHVSPHTTQRRLGLSKLRCVPDLRVRKTELTTNEEVRSTRRDGLVGTVVEQPLAAALKESRFLLDGQLRLVVREQGLADERLESIFGDVAMGARLDDHHSGSSMLERLSLSLRLFNVAKIPIQKFNIVSVGPETVLPMAILNLRSGLDKRVNDRVDGDMNKVNLHVILTSRLETLGMIGLSLILTLHVLSCVGSGMSCKLGIVLDKLRVGWLSIELLNKVLTSLELVAKAAIVIDDLVVLRTVLTGWVDKWIWKLLAHKTASGTIVAIEGRNVGVAGSGDKLRGLLVVMVDLVLELSKSLLSIHGGLLLCLLRVMIAHEDILIGVEVHVGELMAN